MDRNRVENDRNSHSFKYFASNEEINEKYLKFPTMENSSENFIKIMLFLPYFSVNLDYPGELP